MAMPGEFDLIKRYFNRHHARQDVLLGVGDDAALLRATPGQVMAVTVDTLIAGVHFPYETKPDDIGHKSLAVCLSDLASMGAEPAWATLAISLPEADDRWLEGFAAGFYDLAARYGVALIGGDTTRGSLSITVQAMGWVPQEQALHRSGACLGDSIYVTGTLGDAGLGLAVLQSRTQVDSTFHEALLGHLNRPEPRVQAGIALRGLATAAIDISDGLAADLNHLLNASGVGARVEIDRLPLSNAVREADPQGYLALSAGDDYELIFTMPPSSAQTLSHCEMPPYTCIGRIESEKGLRLVDAEGNTPPYSRFGYDHFRGL